jgi:Transcription elongation factor, GreA/GreB, C-term
MLQEGAGRGSGTRIRPARGVSRSAAILCRLDPARRATSLVPQGSQWRAYAAFRQIATELLPLQRSSAFDELVRTAGDVYFDLGEDEADPAHGTISHASPLARALVGKIVGDSPCLETAQLKFVPFNDRATHDASGENAAVWHPKGPSRQIDDVTVMVEREPDNLEHVVIPRNSRRVYRLRNFASMRLNSPGTARGSLWTAEVKRARN